MPPNAGPSRAEQLAELAVIRHRALTAPGIAADLAAAETSDPWHAANLRLMRHAYARANALPSRLVQETARANALCEKVWRVARQANDFALVRPHLETVLSLTRETAAVLSSALGLPPYDALMDGYQQGIGADDMEPLLTEYQAFLTETLPAIEARQAQRPPALRPEGPFPIEAQEVLCRDVAQTLGLDFASASLGRSEHPFSGGTPTDLRITTRYDPDDVSSALLAVVHETGHALYEKGLPTAYERQPVGEAAGMAVHESQSLLMERQTFCSDAVLGWIGGKLRATFGGPAEVWGVENLARWWRHVERGPIRVDADEVTYPAHVILRFRLERALIAGDLTVTDLPGAWNDGMRTLLDVAVPDDTRGCLQDIHWYDGAFGYFPSYTLGAMAAAQIMEMAHARIPGLDEALGRGDFAPLTGWLRTHVHALGNRFGFNEVLLRATGRRLDPVAFESHLRRRYLGATD
jgi:carboxypeptidase Taq